MRRICILVLPSVFDSALTITRDILLAGQQAEGALPGVSLGASFELELVTVGARSIETAGGLQVTAQADLCDIDDADLVLVPGFSVLGGEELPAIEQYLERPDVQSVMRRLDRYRVQGGALAAGCTATFLLAEAGLLDGLQATTSWWLAEQFRHRFPAVDLQAHMMLTHQSGITCAGAALAHTDLALWILGEVRGPAVADHVARRLLLDERVSQGRYMASNHLSRRHPEVPKAEAWIRQRLGERIRIDELASAMALSPRTLARRLHEATGESPLGFVQRLRVEHAVHLLETSALAFEEIAARVGYQEPAGLRRVLRKRTGRSPSDFRHG